ncbi:hypothetical protein DPMN_105784 [Dreissena polymorpha]|uniref:Uncharacterized protein n=1 Tax=Dreissena polymorpha TaxID=45954 RepID=A0A9D4K3V5_DREPO|nr:hypothetical protein DPMN_105784 [Dreissena polymorpha]
MNCRSDSQNRRLAGAQLAHVWPQYRKWMHLNSMSLIERERGGDRTRVPAALNDEQRVRL